MNGIEIFTKIKNFSTFSKLLFSEQNLSKRGKVFEIVTNIIIRFGFSQIFTNDIYNHYEGNINTCKLKKVLDLNQYLKDLTCSKSGASDITLKNKITKEYVFISCKFCDDDSKNDIKYYQVQDIHSAIFSNKHKYNRYKIYLFVNNKKRVKQVINSSEKTNKHLKDDIEDIIGIDELELDFQRLKQSIQNVSLDELDNFYLSKLPLELRFHQDLLSHQIFVKIQEGSTDFLVAAKARSGKTYIVGGTFIKYYKKYNKLNSLIITPAPTETISQFTDDLFRKFRDYKDFNIIEIKKGTEINSMIFQKNNIIIVSKQLLDDYIFDKKISCIKKLNLDFIVFDENHFHGTTEMSKKILETYCSLNTKKLFLTATYSKPLNTWNIPQNCQFYWDIEDEKMCKNRNVQGLINKHGEDVLIFINSENKERLLGVYDKMPNLSIITNMIDMKRYEDIRHRIQDTSFGFSFGTLLSTTKDGNNFNYPREVDDFLKYISGKGNIDEDDNPIRDKMSIFERIIYNSNLQNSRTKLNNGDFTSQLWFLPFGKDMLIDNVSKCLKNRMLKNRVLSQYEIMIVNSKKDFKVKDIKEEIKNKELKGKEEGKSGLIILAGNQLTLGITLPLVDIVFLFNDVLSSDRIYQMMYRCMTETINTEENSLINNGLKKIGFVVDLNISRVLNTMLDYNVYKKELNIEQKIKYLVENNLINIDPDLFQNKENKTELIQKLLNIWKSDPINTFKSLLKKIEDNIIELETEDQKLLNQHFTSSIEDNKINVKVEIDEDVKQPLQSGKEIKTQQDKLICNDEETEEEDEESETENISLTKDVLPYVVLLGCVLTFGDNNYDFIQMLDKVKTTPNLLEVFNEQCFIWWSKKDIIKLIKKIVKKYIKKNSCVYNIAIQFKMSLQSLIDKPKEILEFIGSCLKPKQKEKQENGEVFTPMNIIFEMLDNLDKHYTKQTGRSIFTEKNFKWFDPACGMGNFPVAVYLKLMEWLKPQIPNDEERKKHIIENMLYMSELNKKNVFICHQIFNVNSQYKLNLYEGDTLELNVGNEWDIKDNSFDVILGNPPYNKGGIRSHTGKQLGDKNETIWTKFIEKSFEWLKPDGFLAFINPLSWLKKSHSLHNEMLEKHIVWLKLWDNIKSLATINGKIPISLFILQNTPNTTNKKTDIISEIQSKKLTTTSFEYLNKNYSIPLAFHSIFDKLIQFIEKHNCRLEYKTKTIKSSGTKAKIPTNYTLEDMWAVDTYTIKEGLMVKKATEQHPDANKRKLIISNKASFTGAFIDEGKLGLTGNHKFYILGDNLELVKKMLDFRIINIIGHYTKYGQDFLDNEAFKYLPDIRKLGIADITEDEFYKLIGITEDEIESIYFSKNSDYKTINLDGNEYYLIGNEIYEIGKDKQKGEIYGFYI